MIFENRHLIFYETYITMVKNKKIFNNSESLKLRKTTGKLMFNTFITETMGSFLIDNRPKKILEVGRGY